MKFTPKLVLHATAAAVLVSVAANPAAGQRPEPTSPSPSSAARDARERERDFQERMRALRAVEVMARTPPPEREEPRLALLQIAEDFKLLQVTANAMTEATPPAGALDLKAVAKSASEIRRRASRLRSNLALPKPEKQDERPEAEAIADHEGLRRSLLALDKLIYRFARNPVFSQPDVIDAEQSLKARRDLDEIVELSRLVKKGCEELEKGGKK